MNEETKVYIKLNENSWNEIYNVCKQNNYELIDIVFHTKYPVDNERIFGFSEISQENINTGLILHNYSCEVIELSEKKLDYLTDEEWEYLYPYLKENDLLYKPINIFYKDITDPYIVQIQSKTITEHDNAIKTSFRETYFYSCYYIHVVYKVVNNECPKELEDLFIDNGSCLNALYIKKYS